MSVLKQSICASISPWAARYSCGVCVAGCGDVAGCGVITGSGLRCSRTGGAMIASLCTCVGLALGACLVTTGLVLSWVAVSWKVRKLKVITVIAMTGGIISFLITEYSPWG